MAFGTSTTLATLTRDSAGTPPIYSGSYKLNTSTSLASQVVNDDPHICFKLDKATFRYYRLTFTCASAVKIGVMAIGLKMEFSEDSMVALCRKRGMKKSQPRLIKALAAFISARRLKEAAQNLKRSILST